MFFSAPVLDPQSRNRWRTNLLGLSLRPGWCGCVDQPGARAHLALRKPPGHWTCAVIIVEGLTDTLVRSESVPGTNPSSSPCWVFTPSHPRPASGNWRRATA
jgi:hypothetical protein